MEPLSPALLAELLIWYVVFLFTTTLHEAAHALAAKLGGDLTAYHGGQVTIDPIPHVRREPVGMVVLPILFLFTIHWPFGYASAPYDPDWARRYPKRQALMSLAGPASHLLLLLFAAALMWGGIWAGVFEQPARANLKSIVVAATPSPFGDDPFAANPLSAPAPLGAPEPVSAPAPVGAAKRPAHEGETGQLPSSASKDIPARDNAIWKGLAEILSIFFSMNLILFAFNIIPLPPLDGSGALTLFMNSETAARYQHFMSQPIIGIAGIVLAWRLFDPAFHVVFKLALKLLYPGSDYY